MLSSIRRASTLSLIAVLYAGAVVSAKGLAIKQGKVTVSSSNGLDDVSYNLKEPAPLPSPITLTEASTFKLAFTVVDDTTGDSLVPKQAHLLFEDLDGREDVTLPISVKANGKASFVINTAKPPVSLLPTSGNFHLTLLLSTPSNDVTPLFYPLGKLSLPQSILKAPTRQRHDLPPRAGEPAFMPQQELEHTFRGEEKSVGGVVSAVGTLVALSPSVVLVGLYTKISPSLTFKTPPKSAYIFLATLVGLEGLIFTYWVSWKLYEFLPPFIALAVVSAYTGKVALGSLRETRLKAGGHP